MSGFFGGGSSGSQIKQAVGNLGNVFNYALPQAESGNATGTATTGAGVSAMQGPMQYWQTLLSGNRQALQQAIAPQRNALLAGADAARRQQATMGTARGGGVASTNQQQQSDVMAQINNELFGAQQGAATNLAQTGEAEAGIGLSQQQQAANLLGLGTTASADIGSLGLGARGQNLTTLNDVLSLLV